LKEAKTGPALTGAAGAGGTGGVPVGPGTAVEVAAGAGWLVGEGGTVGVPVGPGTAVETAVGVGSLVGETGLQAPSSSETANDTNNRKLIRQGIFFIAIYLLNHLYSISSFALFVFLFRVLCGPNPSPRLRQQPPVLLQLPARDAVHIEHNLVGSHLSNPRHSRL